MNAAMKILLPVSMGLIAPWMLPGCDDQAPAGQAEVTINGHTFQVELALTEAQRGKGLMGRQELAEDRGMLFIFRSPSILKFYMKNCDIPIDVAFLDANRRIVKIHSMKVEWDRAGRENYFSDKPAQYALEVAGGVFGKLGIEQGDIVEFSDKVPAPAKADP